MFNSASKLAVVGYAEEAGARILSVGGRLCSRLFRSNVLGVILLVSGWLQSREGVFDSTLARICQSVVDFLLLFKTGRVKKHGIRTMWRYNSFWMSEAVISLKLRLLIQ